MKNREIPFPTILLLLVCFCFSPASQALLPPPPPDGGYPNGNTAEGTNALLSLTSGAYNTAIGNGALYNNTTGKNNTATGYGALVSNNGNDNTATGWGALFYNSSGINNTATGSSALVANKTGNNNTANGLSALVFNTIGSNNTATGVAALNYNNQGNFNTADGYQALYSNIAGVNNTAVGVNALLRSTASNNVALGYNAGSNITTGAGNVCIGAGVLGVAGQSNTTRIKNVYTSVAAGRPVYVTSDNKFGTLASSRRYKDEIKPMDKASEAVLALKPVTFRYKKEVEPNGAIMFGLIAEEVERVDPQLVTRDDKGEVETVRYEAVNAMLLNEFLKEHRVVEQLKSALAKQEAAIAQQEKNFQFKVAEQQKQIEVLTAGFRKVSAQVEMRKSAQQVVLNDP
jgi:hypothetical protein